MMQFTHDTFNVKNVLGFTATQQGTTALQRNCIMRLIDLVKPDGIAHGGCVGGDDEIDELAVEYQLPRFIFPSDHPTKSFSHEHWVLRGGVFVLFPKKAPLLRNVDIVKASHYFIGCPSTEAEVLRSGTWATIRAARQQLNLEDRVFVISPSGRMSRS